MMAATTDAKVLSGTILSKEIIETLKTEVKAMGQSVPNFKPGLAIMQVGGREDSNVYIRMKLKAAEEIGIAAHHVTLPRTATQQEILKKLKTLNDDPAIHGIIVQMPLDSINKIDSHLITDSVQPDKDVDGLNTVNEGRVAIGDMDGFIPCTPNGVIELIKRSGVTIAGTNAVVLGRSKIVGTPVAELLKWHNTTVTVCHSRSKDIDQEVGRADILVVGIGKPEFVKGSWIKPGAVVIDCGINPVSDPTRKSGQRLLGDVNYKEAKEKASYITPVPGGVGPMTVAMLMKNTVISAQRALLRLIRDKWAISTFAITLEEPMPSDMELSQRHESKDISSLAQEIGVYPVELIPYGSKKAKLSLNILDRLAHQKNGHYVVVTGINPTPFGEGKTTTAIGLVDALVAHCKVNAMACVRQASQGPTFGVKGGAAGGGHSQIIPMEEFNLHLTGDIHAVTAANNLLAALIDSRVLHEKTASNKLMFNKLIPKRAESGSRSFTAADKKRLNKLNINKSSPDALTDEERERFCRLNIDPSTITWNRVLDTSDRMLRLITIGKSDKEREYQRDTPFSISVASEIMAILALSKDLADMKNRFSKIVVAFSTSGEPITADDLGATGALTLLMKDAIQPTMMQTLAGAPALIHAGPYANIAHGCSSIIADALALKLVGPNGFVVTEAGFGSDIGLEKFFGIKCRTSGQSPDAVVLVVTVRALKMHGGGPNLTPGSVLPDDYRKENIELLRKGLPHLKKHVQNVITFGVPVVVAINGFKTDSPAEWELIKEASVAAGAKCAAVTTNYVEGYAGAANLSEAVKAVCEGKSRGSQFRPLYEVESPIPTKIETIAKAMYGANGVEYSEKAMTRIQLFQEKGYGSLPICVCKTATSLTDDPSVKGVPTNFTIHVNDILLSAGAGFIIAVAGEISTMPGLPIRPCLNDIDIDPDTGAIHGLS